MYIRFGLIWSKYISLRFRLDIYLSIDRSFGHMLENLLKFSNVYLQILVPLEFILHGHYIFCVPDLSLVSVFEILLKLIKLRSQPFSLILNVIQFSCHVSACPKSILLYYCLSLARRHIHNHSTKFPVQISCWTTTRTFLPSLAGCFCLGVGR